MSLQHASRATKGAGASPDTRSLALFIRMWAVAHIIHHTAYTQARLDTPWNVLTVAAAVVVVMRPTSGVWLALMMAAQLADLVAEMPFSADHLMLLGFVDLALLIAMSVRRSWSVASIRPGLPAARAVLLIAYGSAALSKYNTSFLDPVTSCANAIAGTASFGLLRNLDVGPLLGLAVIATETSVVLLLAFPATRRHGVRVAMCFHFLLSASPAFAVVDFTIALYALFLLFLSDDDLGRILDRLGKAANHSAVVRDARRVPWVTAALAFAVFGFAGYLLAPVAIAVAFVFAQIYVVALLLAALLTWRKASNTRAFGWVRWAYVPVLVLELLWAASPYLGLRTTASFTMFSGLRTEGTDPNHLFMPSLRLTDWQDDIVVIETSNDPMLVSNGDVRIGIPLLALRRMATDDPSLEVVGELHGKRVELGPLPGQMRLDPLPAWQHRSLLFRPVAVEKKPFCSVS